MRDRVARRHVQDGRASDPTAVADPELKGPGIDRLRVVDTSVMSDPVGRVGVGSRPSDALRRLAPLRRARTSIYGGQPTCFDPVAAIA